MLNERIMFIQYPTVFKTNLDLFKSILNMEEIHEIRKTFRVHELQQTRLSIIYMYCLDTTWPTNHRHKSFIATGTLYFYLFIYLFIISLMLTITEQISFTIKNRNKMLIWHAHIQLYVATIWDSKNHHWSN